MGQRLGRGGGSLRATGHKPGDGPEIPTASPGGSVNPAAQAGAGRGAPVNLSVRPRPPPRPLCPPGFPTMGRPARPPGVPGPRGERALAPPPLLLEGLNFSPPPRPGEGHRGVSGWGPPSARRSPPLAMRIAVLQSPDGGQGPQASSPPGDRLTPRKRAGPGPGRGRAGHQAAASVPRSAQVATEKNQNPLDGHRGQSRRQPSKCHPAGPSEQGTPGVAATGPARPRGRGVCGRRWACARPPRRPLSPRRGGRPRLLPARWFPSQ